MESTCRVFLAYVREYSEQLSYLAVVVIVLIISIIVVVISYIIKIYMLHGTFFTNVTLTLLQNVMKLVAIKPHSKLVKDCTSESRICLVTFETFKLLTALGKYM